jgi:hypothetical protein
MTEEERAVDPKIQDLRQAVRFFYDLQKLRIQAGNRGSSRTAELSKESKKFDVHVSQGLKDLEKTSVSELRRCLKGIPIWEEWLKDQKGVGPTMGALLLGSVDVHKAPTASALWRFCGLAVDVRTGKAERLVRGEKAHFDPWLKSKMVSVLGGSFLKANSPWRTYYDNKKHRRMSQRVPDCLRCETTGKDPYEVKDGKPVACTNCGGSGHNAPWGRGDAHRHADATRVMVKAFLLELWMTWRELEGLPVRPPYAEEKLGIKHHTICYPQEVHTQGAEA